MLHICIHICIHKSATDYKLSRLLTSTLKISSVLCVCMYVCMYIYIYIYYVCICMYVCICVCIYIYIYTYVYVYWKPLNGGKAKGSKGKLHFDKCYRSMLCKPDLVCGFCGCCNHVLRILRDTNTYQNLSKSIKPVNTCVLA